MALGAEHMNKAVPLFSFFFIIMMIIDVSVSHRVLNTRLDTESTGDLYTFIYRPRLTESDVM